MEIVLLLIAGVVVYFLYNTLQEYLKNPLHPNQQQPYSNQTNTAPIDFQNPYEEMTHTDKIISSEFGILAAILGHVVWSDNEICKLEEQLIDEMLTDMAEESKNPKLSKEELHEILLEQKSPTISLEELCDEYVKLTKGEYKKRLKVVEFLFVIAYADGILQESEKECIIDIAAFFEIANEDFNMLFEQFETAYAEDIDMNEERAKNIFNITKIQDSEQLTEIYHTLIKNAKQNIFDSKNMNKTFRDTSLRSIKEIDKAYKVLLASLKPNSKDNSNTKQTDGKNKKEDSGWDF